MREAQSFLWELVGSVQASSQSDRWFHGYILLGSGAI